MISLDNMQFQYCSFILCLLALLPLPKRQIQQETPLRISVQVETTVPLSFLSLKFLMALKMTTVSYYVLFQIPLLKTMQIRSIYAFCVLFQLFFLLIIIYLLQ